MTVVNIKLGRDVVPEDAEGRRIVAEKDDAAMVGRPDLWPLRPVLALMHAKYGPGVVVEGLNNEKTGVSIYLANVWSVVFGNQQIKNCVTFRYESAGAAVNAGWRVD